jgi:D-threonate/D-erythronate kinase
MSVAAVVADDLTGAADAAAGFLRAGFTAIVTWDVLDVDRRLAGQADVLSIDMGSRVLDAIAARARAAKIVTGLFNAGVTTLYSKVDSMLRGHVGAELSGILEAWQPNRGPMAIVAPAFPALGRTTIDGRQRVNGVVLDRPAIRTLLEQSGVRTSALNLSAVRGGELTSSLTRHLEHGSSAVVCDAEVDADLTAIAEAGALLGHRIVWVGSAGLAHALARNFVPRVVRKTVPIVTGAKAILAVVGSTAAIARQQAAYLASDGAALVEVPVKALDGSDPATAALVAHDIEERLRGKVDVVVTIEGASIHPEPVRLATSLGELLKPMASLVGGLIVTGGETAVHVLRAWRVQALYLLEEVEPGVPFSVAVGARSFPVITKAGSFGVASSLAAARARLRQATTLGDLQRTGDSR